MYLVEDTTRVVVGFPLSLLHSEPSGAEHLWLDLPIAHSGGEVDLTTIKGGTCATGAVRGS